MRLIRFDIGDGLARPGRLRDERVLDLSNLAPTMEDFISGGEDMLAHAEGPGYLFERVKVLAPLKPASLRDFLAFEDHARAGAARRNEEINPAWYEIPVYYKGNHRTILGPDEPLPWPSFTDKLDFECEVAAIVGARVRDCSEKDAQRAIFGYTIMNDWSARDVQRAEMAMRLGPAKSKDFATSLGPCIVTADEFDPANGLQMSVRVDGEVWFETTEAKMHWTFAQMIAHVARGEDVLPCDVYGSGTAYGGCGLDQDRWLARGQTVELEIDGIGILRTKLV